MCILLISKHHIGPSLWLWEHQSNGTTCPPNHDQDNARDKKIVIGEHINNLINMYIHNKNGPSSTPLLLSKGQGLEIGNWNGMQPLHKMYGLITYLTCTIYSYNKI
jgi:hypothetical protein